MGNILCDIVLSNISLYLPSQVRGKKAKQQQQQQQQQTDEVASNSKALAQQRNPAINKKGNLLNGRSYLQIICLIMD